jgi:hypothetical protein
VHDGTTGDAHKPRRQFVGITNAVAGLKQANPNLLREIIGFRAGESSAPHYRKDQGA